MNAPKDLFSRIRPGKSIYSGIRYEPKIQNGDIVFVANADDVAFRKAFDEALDEFFKIPEDSNC